MQGKILAYLNIASSPDMSRCWIIDIGSSRHICYSKSLFESLHLVTKTFVSLLNKSVISVNFSGTIWLSQHLVIKDVLFMPEFQFNLLFVSSLLLDSDFTLLFSKSLCLIQDIWQVIGRGEVTKDFTYYRCNLLFLFLILLLILMLSMLLVLLIGMSTWTSQSICFAFYKKMYFHFVLSLIKFFVLFIILLSKTYSLFLILTLWLLILLTLYIVTYGVLTIAAYILINDIF